MIVYFIQFIEFHSLFSARCDTMEVRKENRKAGGKLKKVQQ